ncbi:EF-hand domain-containing family member C2 [Anastrepha obliqua]|uniref:EF-hand domain-containing family member C2 n=1 Tax=Anastrepha obliqua TaxID=95512 RepID=UPI00240971FE|nr:EF-hand domain-containing family member C2 [Anastrepha obliqua]
MLRIPGMPFLPGTTFRDMSRTKYPKPQSLMNFQGISMLNDRQTPAMVDAGGMCIDINCPPTATPSFYPPQTGPKLPPWIAYDKKVLGFDAFFKETLHEVYNAPYQVRKVKIMYYLEDGTMQITEPKIDNSGIPQGCLVHRQRIPKPPPCQNEFISILDLNVDTTIEIFDRKYHITNCDIFTRQFLNRSGIAVPDPVDMPVDPTTEMRKRSGKKTHNQPPKKHPFAQFLAFDRKVLKFHGYWDDRSEFGDVRKLEICYYLADDTMDIKEIFPRNSGREGPSLFLKRGKLPREFNGLPLPGQETPQTLLNVLGTSMRNVRYTLDPLNMGEKEVLYYADRDLQIGTVLNVYGRAVVLTDCDEYTQEYYRKRYGIEDFTPAPIPLRGDDCAPTKQKERILPPYNGWGSYEDSEGNCISVEPKPPQSDFKKFIKLDRYVLRFGAKLLSTIRENCERIFVISYYLSDDTIQIFEIAERNSGFLGGEFMKRTRIPLPGQEKFTSKRPQCYQPYNFYIGATMSLKDHIFHIVSADEYTLIYMEHHPYEYPMADIKTIMAKIREAAKADYKSFLCQCLPEGAESIKDVKFIGFDSLKRALINLLNDDITNHEIITVCRYFSAEKAPPQSCNRETVRAAVHLELKRYLWNAMDELKEHLHHINPLNKPFLSETKLRSTIKGCRLPFVPELVDDLLLVLNHNDCGEVEVCDFLNFIDMGCGKVPDIAPMNINFELCPKIPFLHKGRLVNITCFLQHLGLDEETKPKEEPVV